MNGESLLQERLKQFTENQKFEILKSLDERFLREEIRELISSMDSMAYVEITHGSDEYGKDLVVIQRSKFGEVVVAVVVVRGDIHTRSSGIIDKIKSQVEQCFEHPALIKAVKGPLNVSHAWIMVAGMLSKGANIRLTKEMTRPNIKIFDLKWLSDNFSKYYPHVFFEGRVSKYLEDKIQELESQHLLSGRKSGLGKNLSDYYVQPSVATVDEVLELSENNMTFVLLSNIKHFEEMKDEMTPLRKFMVVGDPGVGKSTALTKLAIDMMSECLGEATALRSNVKRTLGIPILVKAKDIVETSDLQQLLDKHGPSKEIRNRFTIRALLIDALDEVYGQHREKVIKQSIDYTNELSASLIICSRKIDTIREETLKLERRELVPFEFSQALDLFKRLVTDNKMLESLKDGLERVQHQLSLTPMSLLFMVELVENNKEVPASIVELYDRFVDIALGSEDRIKKGMEVLFDYQIKRRFLQEIAYEQFFRKNRDFMEKSEFDSFVSDYAKRFDWDPERIGGFVLEIERAGLLSIKDRVTFVHASYLDYFAACHIADIREEVPNLNNYIADIYFDDLWCDIAFFYAGARRKIPEQLLSLVLTSSERGDDIRVNVAKMLVGKLLQAAWHSTGEVKSFGIRGALDYREKVRVQASEFMDKCHGKLPIIYADWYTMAISRLSFGSRFLWSTERVLIDKYIEENSQQSIANAIHLVWSIRDKIPEDELNHLASKLLGSVAEAPKNSAEDNIRYTENLLLLNVVSANDPAICKSIMKRIRRAYKLDSGLFDRLMPPKKNGFRSTKLFQKSIEKARRRELIKAKKQKKK